MSEFLEYVQSIQGQILSLSCEHVELTLFSVILAIAIGVPLGILISYLKKLTKPVLGIANIVQAIPSLALLGFAIPFLGIGSKPAIFMVILYSLLPIIKNTYTGIQSIPDQTLEAAKGIGMTRAQILIKVQIPMALPIIMAGVRISAVTADDDCGLYRSRRSWLPCIFRYPNIQQYADSGRCSSCLYSGAGY